MATIDILLATYNAGAHLEEQLDSLLRQGFSDWRLLVRDDCSQDDTAKVIASYSERHPRRIHVAASPPHNEGATRTFSALLERSDAAYLMFCDQDDVWLPDKIERSLDRMRALEASHGLQTPLLVHTDLKVVDRGLRVRADSFWSHSSLDPRPARPLKRLLMRNFVTGCTAMFNRPLRNAALPVPRAALVHDWWLALVGAATGRVESLAEATVLYRQHGGNEIGAAREKTAASAAGTAAAPRRPFTGLRRIRRDMRSRERQAQALLERHAERMRPDDRWAVEVFSNLSRRNFVLRRFQFLRQRFTARGFRDNLEIWLSL